ncbi:MAG: glycosyltransferase family 39 protein [Peptococcaceae bacterium]|nr:glycosyltransferase family 39 protein [Peptococcaceae bacterium]
MALSDIAKNRRIDPLLIGIALLAAFLNIYGIWKDQFANSYYTAAVASMLQSWHNFFYASLDPGGFVTVDKPPVAFWLQTLSASLLGLHGWSVILPQALAGVGSVILVYVLVKPSFGQWAARLAALVAAGTPIAIAVSRTNNVDSLLVFVLLLASWLLFKAARTSKWIWSLAAFGVIGVGFNVKMLQAYMILPAFYLFCLIAFKAAWRRKLGILAASTAILLAVSFSWPLIVDSVPKENRPYIGSSQTNSVLELAFGYNGLSRLTGMRGPGPQGQADNGQSIDGRQNLDNGGQNFRPGQDGPPGNGAPGQTAPFNGNNPRGPMGGGGGAFNTGQPGPLRLFQSQLAGQISWLLPLALFGAGSLLLGIRRRELTDKEKETLFWLAWLLPCMGFFSVAGFFHSYYLIMLAPPIAALVGAGWAEIYGFYRDQDNWKKWFLPVGLLAGTLFEIYMLMLYQAQTGTLLTIVVGVSGIGLSLLLCLLLVKRKQLKSVAWAAILVLLVSPLYWAATPLLYGGNSTLPEAGPQLRSSANPDGMRGMNRENVNADLFAYLTKNNTGEKYLFATTDSHTAAPYIIQTGQAVMAMGGFSGSDPILTVEKLQEMIRNKEVKYFLLSSGGFGGRGSSEILQFIREKGKEIPQENWQGAGSTTGSLTLYEVTLQ